MQTSNYVFGLYRKIAPKGRQKCGTKILLMAKSLKKTHTLSPVFFNVSAKKLNNSLSGEKSLKRA